MIYFLNQSLYPVPICSRLFPSFSSTMFSVSGFMLSTLNHLDLIFYKVIHIDLFEFLNMQISSYIGTICWRCCLFPTIWLCPLCQNQVSIGVWVYFWLFDLILLINLSVSVLIPFSFFFYHYCFVAQLEVRDGDSSRHSFIVQDRFSYTGFLFFHMELRIAFSRSVKSCVEILKELHLICRLLLVRWTF